MARKKFPVIKQFFSCSFGLVPCMGYCPHLDNKQYCYSYTKIKAHTENTLTISNTFIWIV